MTITAKFASTCPCCSKPIRPGEKVEWAKGEKARHVACAGTASATTEAAAAPAGRSITVERVGRRSYLRGDTMAVRGLLRSGGCHWDAEAKAWWIGAHETALQLAAECATAPAEAAPVKRITHCVGCGCSLDLYTQRRGYKFCSKDCVNDMRLGGMSGYVDGVWHQGSDD